MLAENNGNYLNDIKNNSVPLDLQSSNIFLKYSNLHTIIKN